MKNYNFIIGHLKKSKYQGQLDIANVILSCLKLVCRFNKVPIKIPIEIFGELDNSSRIKEC